MDALRSALTVIHVVTAILMVWPFYALVIVNQRTVLGPPLGDRADTYLENIIKNRTNPCLVFQATALITGLALVLLNGMGWESFVTVPALGLKLLLLVVIAGLLLYVRVRMQPRIDALFAQAGSPIPVEVGAQIGRLRLRRKRFAAVCMFIVLTISILGVQVRAPFPWWLTIVLVVATGAFTWRAYKTVTPYGWA